MTSTTYGRPNRLRIAVLVIGAMLLLKVIGYIVTIAVVSAARADASREVTIGETFEAVDVTTEVTDVSVEYADVNATVLIFAQNDDRRNMSFDAEVSSSTLHVSVIDHEVGWWMPSNFNNSPSLTVTLPRSLEGLNLTMDSGVGNIRLDGAFGKVDFTGNVGDLRLEGSASSGHLETAVGNITAEGFEVTGDLTIESKTGNVTLSLDTMPTSLNVASDVGNQNIILPLNSYRIETSTDVGNVQLDAETDPDSGTVLRFETSVGNISVRN